ncbi:putative mitochondrial distribution and morphology protein 10 [Papiliotrema laurentii]|uniref:Mitochondrial distribution and morphology protein 10 n=1 Tax=Papiliotrema laurentii TaxID=5418 RepID=A0AAD9FTB1_PAPLA|nr:putative mitochondrial distribution and morphology protein 10 [Papiliotrema laurentii]
MLPFSAILLRDYYNAIGWNEDNQYTQLTRSSSSLLDFQIPSSLILQLANSPTPIFFTSYSLDALPQLNGAISYITTSEPLEEIGPSRSIPFRHVVERFRIYPPPKKPSPKPPVFLAGRRIEGRDYLLYSRLHLPSLHLSGLATTRLTPTLQAHLAFLSQPSPPTPRASSSSPTPNHIRQPSESSAPAPPPVPGNVLLSLQHDTGRYSGEYTYSAQDGMFGVRGLYNFGYLSGVSEEVKGQVEDEGGRRVDEEEMMEGGLRGRFSAGGEVYFSAKQRSFGISTGLRFTTLPPVLTPGSPPPSPPTTLTLLYNPLIGFISSAYSAQISPTVALSSRFGVNIYSYESDLSIGGEWWIGRRRGKRNVTPAPATTVGHPAPGPSLRGEDQVLERRLDSPFPIVRDVSETEAERIPTPVSASPRKTALDPRLSSMKEAMRRAEVTGEMDRDGILKARLSGNWSFAMLYEARIRNCLVSVGFISDLAARKPIRSVGLEVQYFS